jgi:DNA-binding MarR family transcriptional regulator
MNRSETLHTIFENMSSMQRLVHARFQHTLEEFDLSPSQMRLLTFIAHVSSITPKDLANKLGLTPGAITQLIDNLYRAGYIERTQDEADRRITHLALSRRGKRKMTTLQKNREDIFKEIVATLNDSELQAFLHVQEKMIAYFGTTPSNT